MKKNEYMKSLKSALLGYDAELSAEIMEEFENHFAEGIASGMSEEEIIDELGPVREVADNIGEMYETLGKPSSAAVEKEATTEESAEGESIGVKQAADSAEVKQDLIVNETETKPTNELEVIKEKKRTDGSKEESGLILADVDTIIIDGNLEVNLMRGVGDGHWEYKPSFSMNFGFSLWSGFFSGKEQFEIDVERYNRVLRFNLPKGSGKLTIEVPDYVRVIEIDGRASDVKVSDLDLAEFRTTILAGDCIMSNCRIDKLSIDSKSGDVDTEAVHGDMKVSSLAGDVEIKDHQGPGVYADAMAGDIEIVTSSPCVEVSAKAGDVDVEMFGPVTQVKIEALAGDVDFETASKDYTAHVRAVAGDIENRTGLTQNKTGRGSYTIGEGAGEVKIKTMAGDVTIR